jgi:hypothetical protein
MNERNRYKPGEDPWPFFRRILVIQALTPASTPAPHTNSHTLSLLSNSDQSPDAFIEMCSNYLSMLTQEADDPATTTGEEQSQAMDSVDPFDPPADYAAQSMFGTFSGDLHRLRIGERPTLTIDKDSPMSSPEYHLSEYLTSPVDDSPLLTTPHFGSEMLTSPLLSDVGDDMELFGGISFFDSYAEMESAPVRSRWPTLDMDNLYAMPSPVSPCLDPSSVYTSPQVTMSPSSPLLSSSKPKSTATGIRKIPTLESIFPTESRKELPEVDAKKRARSQVFGEE